ncbi:DUF1772 domain-containing protein [Candidatus Methylobacter favarea]|uniref:DUF1772 domain-containing protein n=1 Tax=Candidatus Methylobacter favarea TaxID=2707345 RepID=UPI00157D4286|nr:DUF1772 domain-containing protein [Candidatus Methylobacter favarea]
MHLLVLRFITLVLVALGLTMGTAHLLELPPKMQYDAVMYAAVTSTLYRLFGSVGAFIQVASILAVAILAFLVRFRPAFRLTLFATLSLIFSLILWFALVAPVNAEWLQVIESTPEFVPKAYLQLRDRWEYGHVAAFIAWFCGFCLLVLSVLIE